MGNPKLLLVALGLLGSVGAQSASVRENLDRCLGYLEKYAPELNDQDRSRLEALASFREAADDRAEEEEGLLLPQTAAASVGILSNEVFMVLEALSNRNDYTYEELLKELEPWNLRPSKANLEFFKQKGWVLIELYNPEGKGVRDIQDVYELLPPGDEAIATYRENARKIYEKGQKDRGLEVPPVEEWPEVNTLSQAPSFEMSVVLNLLAKPLTDKELVETVKAYYAEVLETKVSTKELSETVKELRSAGWISYDSETRVFTATEIGESARLLSLVLSKLNI